MLRTPLRTALIRGTTLLVALSLTATAALAQTPEDLWKAAQKGDFSEVKRLVEAGVDVDAKTRYGGTALGFAADKGSLEMVEFLLSKGADPNVTDTFYNATPMSWTLMKRQLEDVHFEIAQKLLAAGSEQGGDLLMAAIGRGKTDVVKAVLASDNLSDEQAKMALADAKRRNATAIVELIEQERGPFEEAAKAELTEEQRQRLVGSYVNKDFELELRIFTDGDAIKGQMVGQPAFDLDALSADVLNSTAVPGGLELTFSGEPQATNLHLEQGVAELDFVRKADGAAAPETAVAAASEAPKVDAAPVAQSSGRKAERTAAKNWAGFRGGNGTGVADGQGVPLTWDGEKRENVRWRTEVPGIATSSPVIWDGRIFVTTAISEEADETFRTGLYGDVDSVDDESEHSFEVWALDLQSGDVLWKQVASRSVPKVKRHLKSSHANPTPVTDGERLVVSFASEGLFCYDLDGKLLWKTDLGVLNSGWFYDASYEWGFASSPILHDGKVIAQVDIQEQSFIAAFDLATGKQLWRTDRDEIPTWGTPSILPGGDGQPDEVITNGTTIRGYNADTGEELWTLGPNGEVTVATPVIAGGLAIVTANYPPARPIYAIRPGSRGDLSLEAGQTSSDAIAWSHPRDGVYIPTPIAYDGVFYALRMNGRLSAYDMETGERIYRERVGKAESFSGSSVASDGKLYFTTETGKTFVVRAGEPFEIMAENELGEVVMSTPAISDGVFVVRSIGAVWGLGAAPADGP